MPQTLYEKLWQDHLVHQQADGTALIYIDRHLVHEVTSPQAFEGLKLAGRKPWRVSSIVATADHNTPTDHWDRGIEDPISRLQVETLDANIRAVGALAYFPFRDPRVSRTCGLPPRWSRAGKWPATSGWRWWFRVRDWSNSRRSAKGWTKFFLLPVSSGASPAVRCAWR